MSGADLDAGPVLLTPADLARRWAISARTLERWRAQGTGPAWLCLGGQVRYRLADVAAHEAAARQGCARDAAHASNPDPASGT